MADAVRLSSEDGKMHVWGCGMCLHTCTSEAHARTCCTCRVCGVVLSERFRAMRRLDCEACDEAQRAARMKQRYFAELKLIAGAEIIDLEDYDVDQVSTDAYGDEDSYHDAHDCYATDPEGQPVSWAWACIETTLGPGSIDARDTVDRALEEWFEGAVDHFDVAGLQRRLDEWVAEQKSVRCYHVATPRRIVVLDPERRAEVEKMVEEAKRELAKMETSDVR